MKACTPAFCAAAFFTATAFAQIESPSYVSRELRFQHATTAQQFQEIAMVVRVTAELPQVNVMETAGRLTIRGPKDRIPTAEWLFAELDQPPPPQLPSASEVHLMSEQPQQENAVRVFRPAHAANPQALQELATILRSIGEIRRVLTAPSQNTIAIRGTEPQLKLAEWVLAELDRPPGKAVTTGREYLTRNMRQELLVRVFVLPAMPPQRLQEIAAEVRKTANTSYLFTYNPLPAIAVRTTPEQMALVAGLFQQRGW